ncbi:Rpn family recombination-promoting nuclease/putative transposase [uncultured Parabacteroides sp.]|uniref:Rpn family recombination-promoting nuclease/putative transposase n=1 Tax=uncultured Parabacteroides sp. TaxID=512312 RepID=UPI0025EA3F61|nr:Rpn family recombination-promoting nuclease/putative transposase [uncultured Parabacteroides sp.]
MNKFVNPFSDYGWKKIFGSEVNKDLIISFLNEVIQHEVIVDITFRNVEMLGLKHDQRRAVFDIFCENDKGEVFIIEMQKSRQKYFSDRVLYYASFAIQQQSMIVKEKLGEELEKKSRKELDTIHRRWNYHISKVYVVCVLNYIMDPTRPDKYRWDIVRMDRELKIPFSETLNEIYLEMPKFVLPLQACDTLYKKWLFVLNNIEIMERLPEELNNQIFRKLKSIVEVERMTPDQRLEYELSLSVERDLAAALDTSFEDGMEKGLEKGVEKGKAEGKAEEQRLIATNLKKQGVNVETIAQCTGLSIEEINEL